MDYQEFRRILGDLAHTRATVEYQQLRQGQHLFFHNVLQLPSGQIIPIGSVVPGFDLSRKDLGDPYLAQLLLALQSAKTGQFFLEPSDPGKSRQPDLASVELHEIYEIKPNTKPQIASGLKQLAAFRALLQQGDVEHLAISAKETRYRSALYDRLVNRTWAGGVSFAPKPQVVLIPGLGELKLHYRQHSPGLLVWDTEGDKEEVKKKVEGLARDIVRFLPAVPPGENEQEMRKRAKDLAGKPQIANGVRTLVRALGKAVVVVALTGLIYVLAASLAVPLCFALALGLVLFIAAPPGPDLRLI